MKGGQIDPPPPEKATFKTHSLIRVKSAVICNNYILVLTCVGGRFGINCPSTVFKIFKNDEGDLSQKLPKPKMWVLVNHTKPRNTLY